MTRKDNYGGKDSTLLVIIDTDVKTADLPVVTPPHVRVVVALIGFKELGAISRAIA